MAVPVAAITAALSALRALVSNPEALNNAAEIARAASKAIAAGAETAGVAAEALSPAVRKVADAGVEAGGKAKEAAGKAVAGATGRVGKLFGDAAGAVKDAQDARAQEKALAEARRQILLGASSSLSAEDFEDSWRNAEANAVPMPLKTPGYYAIATYKGKPGKDGAAKYTGIFMGRSEDMGASIHRHLSGGGNPDVYADFKHGQYVHVYAYADFDDTDDNNATLLGFSVALGAHESYNARMGELFEEDALKFDIVLPLGLMQDAFQAMNAAFHDVTVVEQELCGDGIMTCRVEAKIEH